MKMESRRNSILACLFAITALCASGCSKHTDDGASPEERGAQMQQAKIMNQDDYVRIDKLGRGIYKSHVISDTDLMWTVNLLKTSGNAIARARAMTVLSEIRPMTQAQKDIIRPAVTPFLNSGNALDQLDARKVEKALER